LEASDGNRKNQKQYKDEWLLIKISVADEKDQPMTQ
jgi:hypothetical protein